MNAVLPTVRLTATCDFCGAENHLTLNSVHEDQPVSCSTCGGDLGTIAELDHPVVTPSVVRARRQKAFAG